VKLAQNGLASQCFDIFIDRGYWPPNSTYLSPLHSTMLSADVVDETCNRLKTQDRRTSRHWRIHCIL